MSRTTRYALIAAAALLTVIGLTAVVAVLRGSFGPIETRLITSAAILLAASAVAAVGVHARLSARAPRLGAATALLAGLAAALAIVPVWLPDDTAPVTLGKAVALATIAALATGLHSALRTWARDPRWLVWGVVALTYAAGLDAAVMIVRDQGSPPQERFLAAALILVALGIVLLPILSRLRAGRSRPTAHT